VTFNKKIILSSMLLSCVSLFAVEYTEMSTDELMSLRGIVPVEDIELYGSVLTARVKKLDINEMRKYGILNLIKKQNNIFEVECSCNKLDTKLHQ